MNSIVEQNLGAQWGQCLRMALEAVAAGSLGISSIITNSHGDIVSKGRNQLFDNQSSINKIAGTLVSHAEINAIANLPEEFKSDKNVILYTTVEPCPMCAGAIAMSSIKQVRAATSDPWAGALHLFDTDKYMNRKGIQVQWAGGIVEEVFFYLHLLSHRSILEPPHPFYESCKYRYPEMYEKLDELELNEAVMSALQFGDADGFLRELLAWRQT